MYCQNRHTVARRNIPPKLSKKSLPIFAVKYPVIIPRTLPDDNCWKSTGARETLKEGSRWVNWWRGATPPTISEPFISCLGSPWHRVACTRKLALNSPVVPITPPSRAVRANIDKMLPFGLGAAILTNAVAIAVVDVTIYGREKDKYTR